MPDKLHIGVLSLQGSIKEHITMLSKIENIEPVEVKCLKALEYVDGIILPGGESTTMSKLLVEFGLFVPLKQRIENGLPVWGTCAGMILLAKNIIDEKPQLELMNITVQRNAYGRQVDSFNDLGEIPVISDQKIPLVFIRAPWIESAGKNVEVLYCLNHHIVAAKEKNMLVTAFHPELTNCLCVHQYFIKMVMQ
jgi:pyridoxal 5'-phosphate synthase pdxT subunit